MKRRVLTERCLEAAVAIGDELCQEALWHENRCTWLGRSPGEGDERAHAYVPTVTALGADLYTGTAGVALFLAELHSVSRQASHRATAEGALRHAASRIDRLPSETRLGLFSGAVGIAYAMSRAARVLSMEEPLRQALHISTTATSDLENEHPLDLVGGNAGAICALLDIRAWIDGSDRDALLETAERLGRELVASARKTDRDWSWENQRATGGDMGPRPLNGLAHGAAGLGLALLQLSSATGSNELLEGALGAFAYEDSSFSPQQDNWPDLRWFGMKPPQGDGVASESVHDALRAEGDAAKAAGGSADAGHKPPEEATSLQEEPIFMTAWCHGAPGIGLSRLRAWELLPDLRSRLRASIDAAVRSTYKRLEELDDLPVSDASPCHGIAGLVELLLVVGSALEQDDAMERAACTWETQLKKRAQAGTWTTGVASGGKNPSLMLGTAGIGYSLLRFYDPARVPSILLLGHRSPVARHGRAVP